jgi:glucan biosynthesis protein C
MHLWFLYYLLIFYTVSVLILLVFGSRSPSSRIAVTMTTSPLCVLWWSAITTLTLLPMPFPGIQGSTLLTPPVKTLVAYGVFFVFGWLLWRARDELALHARRWGSHLALAIAGLAGYVALEIAAPAERPRLWHLSASTMVALSTWGFILALIGLFVRFASHERRIVRYLSYAAYWTYLVHLPIVVWTAGTLVHAPLSAFAKFFVVLTVTTAVCLLTYHVFVRTTVIGRLLNGPAAAAASRSRPKAADQLT